MSSHNRNCPICNSANKKIIKFIKMIVPEDFLLPSEYDIVACENCGCVFNDVPYSEAYDKFYSEYKDNANFTIPSDVSYFQNKEIRENRHLKTANFIENNTQLSKEASILDVGCSYGATLFALKDKGYSNLYGLDLDKKSISYLQESGITSKVGSVFTDNLNEFNNKFDLIIISHVLEHLHEPKKAIDNVSGWLKPNGKIMIECPDLYQYPETSEFPGFFAEYEHINHFSIISLMNLMSNFNLKAFRSDTTYVFIEEDFPCLYTLFERAESINNFCKTSNDELCMMTSLTELNKRGKIIFENIEILKNTKIALWGAGQYLNRLLTHTPLKDCNIQHIVDKNPDKWGKVYFNKQIEDPRVLKNFEGVIVICTTTYSDSAVQDIEKMGLDNKIMTPFKKGYVY